MAVQIIAELMAVDANTEGSEIRVAIDATEQHIHIRSVVPVANEKGDIEFSFDKQELIEALETTGVIKHNDYDY